MALLQKIVVTGNSQPPDSQFYYPDKIKVQGNIFNKVKLQMNWCWTGESKPPE